MGRANVDEELYNDPRFRRLCRLLAWPHPDFVAGALTRLWIFASNRVDADNPRGLVPLDDADDATDHRGFVEACIQSGMARDEDGFIYFCGMEERAENLAKRAPSKGGKVRAATAIRDERGRMLPSGRQQVTSKLVQHDSSALDSDSSHTIQRIQPSAQLSSAQLSSAQDPRPGSGVLELPIPMTKQIAFDLDAIYALYPRKVGKKHGLQKLAKIIRTQATYDQVLAAVKNYAEQIRASQTEERYVKHFDTWVGEWEDWAPDPDRDGKPANGSQPTTPARAVTPLRSAPSSTDGYSDAGLEQLERDARRFGLVDAEGNPT